MLEKNQALILELVKIMIFTAMTDWEML